MKRFFLFLAICLVGIDLLAQEHLSFKGIPIDGSMTTFCQKLKEKGFTSIGRNDNVALFTGTFTGRSATIGVASTDDGKDVIGIVVLFDSSGEWKNLVNTYNYYKDLYIQKYGEPSISQENNPASTDSNISLMREVDQGTVVYASAWEVAGGDIELSIEKSESRHYEGNVRIIYRNSQNMQTKIQNDLDDI